jgi:hypothetical protein
MVTGKADREGVESRKDRHWSWPMVSSHQQARVSCAS